MYKFLCIATCLFATSFAQAQASDAEKIILDSKSNVDESANESGVTYKEAKWVLKIELEQTYDAYENPMVHFSVCKIEQDGFLDLSSCQIDPELEELKISYKDLQIHDSDIEEFKEYVYAQLQIKKQVELDNQDHGKLAFGVIFIIAGVTTIAIPPISIPLIVLGVSLIGVYIVDYMRVEHKFLAHEKNIKEYDTLEQIQGEINDGIDLYFKDHDELVKFKKALVKVTKLVREFNYEKTSILNYQFH